MGFNPFKGANLEDLQQILRDFLSEKFGFIAENLKIRWNIFLKKSKERITIMLIPHSEKKIINFHVPIYSITLVISAVLIIVIITSIAIIDHASTIKDVSKLKMYGSNSKIQISKFKDEINKLYDIFQKFKPEVTHLYSLTNEKDSGSLWAKGGIPNPDPNPLNISGGNIPDKPSIEELNIKEIEQELKTTRNVLEKIKTFLETRKRIIESTPSIWPAQGYIISKFGSQSSLYSLEKEYYNGIGIAAFPGAEIKATAPGEVESVEWDPALGLRITISHRYGFTTVYSHCGRVNVSPPEKSANGKITKQKVSKGETIGYVGRTGKAYRHMCYYQVRIGTECVDPMPYLNKISQ
jgi:hypothetical protein